MAQQRRLVLDGTAGIGTAEGGVGSAVSAHGNHSALRALDGSGNANRVRRACKRALDVIASGLALIVLLPLTMLIALAIVLDSPGSPFFVHVRIGRFGEPFGVLKFRTMQKDAQDRLDHYLATRRDLRQQWASGFKLVEDPRVTRVGRVLRRWSLDEVPQFLNVLLGSMSLVGPRPVTPAEAPYFGSDLPLVLSVRPGLTGLWAVSGRSNLPYRERAALEAGYVREWSVGRDLAILLRTVPAVIGRRGAW